MAFGTRRQSGSIAVVQTDKDTIQKLSFRSDLPRLSKEETFLFAVLDKEELALPEVERVRLIADEFMRQAFMPLYAEDDPKPQATLRAYRAYTKAADFAELELAFDVTNTKRPHVCGHVRAYHERFLYFVNSSSRTLAAVPEAADWQSLKM